MASLKFHEAVLGGTFIDSGTLAEMMKFARAKIWSHLEGIMAVSGVSQEAVRHQLFIMLRIRLYPECSQVNSGALVVEPASVTD